MITEHTLILNIEINQNLLSGSDIFKIITMFNTEVNFKVLDEILLITKRPLYVEKVSKDLISNEQDFIEKRHAIFKHNIKIVG